MEEKRKHQRVNTVNLLSYVILDEAEKPLEQGMGRTLDLSQGGLLVETKVPIEGKYLLLMAIDIKDELIKIKGKIVYSMEKEPEIFHTGVRFVESNERIHEIIVDLIKVFYHQKDRDEITKSAQLIGFQNIFVPEDGTVTIRCPYCLKEQLTYAKKFIGQHKFKVKCTCKAVFGIQLEFREKYRKETSLDAFIEIISKEEKWGKIMSDSLDTNPQSVNSKINNMSALGLGITVLGKNKIKKGDHIRIEFTLDNSVSSKIEKKAVVVRVQDNYIGCEFFQTDKYGRDLRFYFLS